MSRGQKFRLQKKKLQKEKELKEKQKKRADAKLKNVIINENEDEKFEKYKVSKLPFEFGNKRQYEKSIAQPIGPEWNTLTGHTNFTKPEVVVRPGLSITPLDEPNKPQGKRHKTPTSIRRTKKK